MSEQNGEPLRIILREFISEKAKLKIKVETSNYVDAKTSGRKPAIHNI